MNSTYRRLVLATLVAWTTVSTAGAIELEDPAFVAPQPTALTTYTATMPLVSTSSLESAGTRTNNLGSFNIVLVPNASLSSNAAALAAFERAAAQWEARISDPITVTINAQLASLGSGIIGSASSLVLQDSYTNVRNRMALDAGDEVDDTITLSLPTVANFAATLPAGRTLNGNVIGTKANFKALGYSTADADFGVTDATITFSSAFNFDYDNSNGVGAGLTDFETVAAHEIGHALGFISAVDDVDAGDTSISPTTMDLYRFLDGSANDPSSTLQFATATRDLSPGATTISDFVLDSWNLGTVEYRMSTGVTLGDGRQASHWKADEATGVYIGIMDPTLAGGVIGPITEVDFRTFDLMGWDIAPLAVAVPEPGTWGLLIVGGIGIACLRRRQTVVAN